MATALHQETDSAESKTAPRIFFAASPHARPVLPTQVTETHLESVTYVYRNAPGCVVAPNSGPVLTNGSATLNPEARLGNVAGTYTFTDGLTKASAIVDNAGKNDREANVWMQIQAPTGKWVLVVAESRTSNRAVDPMLNYPGRGAISVHNHIAFGTELSYHPDPNDYGLSGYLGFTKFYLVDPTGKTIGYQATSWRPTGPDSVTGSGNEDKGVYLIPQHPPYTGKPHD